jgi:hypothetical protein
MRTGLQMDEAAQAWKNAATRASNLSQAELIFGDVAAAVSTAEKGVALAERASDTFQMMAYRTDQADAIHAAGSGERLRGCSRTRSGCSGSGPRNIP